MYFGDAGRVTTAAGYGATVSGVKKGFEREEAATYFLASRDKRRTP